MIAARCCATRGHLALSTTATDLQLLTPTDVCFSPQTPQNHPAAISSLSFCAPVHLHSLRLTLLPVSLLVLSNLARASKSYLTCGVSLLQAQRACGRRCGVLHDNVGISPQQLSHLSSANECSQCAWTPLPSQHGHGKVYTFSAEHGQHAQAQQHSG